MSAPRKQSTLLRNPDGGISLSRVAFAASLVTVLAKVVINGLQIGTFNAGTIDGGMIAALLGASGVAYVGRAHSQGMNGTADPKA